MADADAKVPHVACRDIGRVALAAAQLGPPSEGKRYLPAFTDYISGEEICKILEKWHRKPFKYSCPPDLVLKLFAHEALLMKRHFNEDGRPPHSTDPASVAQMHECR